MAEILTSPGTKARAVRLTRSEEALRELKRRNEEEGSYPFPLTAEQIIQTHKPDGSPVMFSRVYVVWLKRDLWDGVDLIPEECIVE